MSTKKKTPRLMLALLCGKCGAQNYLTSRNKTNTPEKLKLIKYCNWCKLKTEHKESSKLK
jgi:large subunit ribosomal protein L33